MEACENSSPLKDISLFVLRSLILMSLMLCLVACGANPTPLVDAQIVDPNILPTSAIQIVARATFDPANANLVARVNGVPISREQFDKALSRSFNPNVADSSALERQVLENLIQQVLIEQAAPSLGISVTDADVEAEMVQLKSLVTDWNAYLNQNGFTEADMLAAQREQLLTRAVLNALVRPYLGDIEQVNARHILVQDLPTAEEVLRRLQAGEDFAALAAQYSIDSTSKERGGSLGWFTRNELFQTNLEDIAFTLNAGQMAGPIQTDLGYHIIQVMEKAARPIEAERLPMLQETVYYRWLEEQEANANIERYIQW